MGITNLLFIPTYVPILVFVGLLILAIIYGALAGWKRAAYWGGSAIIWLFLGWILFACTKNIIANAIIKKVGSSFGDFDVHGVMVYAITSVVSIVFYLIVILIGTVLVSVPLWYALFRRHILHIYSEKYASKHKIKIETRSTKYKVINALIGASSMTVLFLPIISDLTSVTMVVSTDYHVLNSNIKDDPWTNKKGHPSKSTQGFLKTINNISKLPFYANDTLMLTTTMNGIFELMSKPSKLNNSVLNTYIDSLKDLFQYDTDIEGTTITVESMMSAIKNKFEKHFAESQALTDGTIIPYKEAVGYAKVPFQNVLINNHITDSMNDLLGSLFNKDTAKAEDIRKTVALLEMWTGSADTIWVKDWSTISNQIKSVIIGPDILNTAAQYYSTDFTNYEAFDNQMSEWADAGELAWLPPNGTFSYSPLATEAMPSSGPTIVLGTEGTTTATSICLPCHISSKFNISKIGVPTKVLAIMSDVVKISDGDSPEEDKALASKFANYFYSDKNPNGNDWSIKDI